jgi:hypothetical protein
VPVLRIQQAADWTPGYNTSLESGDLPVPVLRRLLLALELLPPSGPAGFSPQLHHQRTAPASGFRRPTLSVER